MTVPRGSSQQPKNLQLPASAIHVNEKNWISSGLPFDLPFNITCKLPTHLHQYCNVVAGHIILDLQENANTSALRIFSYNLYSRDGYQNPRFSGLVENAVEYLEVLLTKMPIEEALQKIGKEYSQIGTMWLLKEFPRIETLCTRDLLQKKEILIMRYDQISNEKNVFYRARGDLIPNGPPPANNPQWVKPQSGADMQHPYNQAPQQQYYNPQQQQPWPPQQQFVNPQQWPPQQQYYNPQQQQPWPPQQPQQQYYQPQQQPQQQYIHPQAQAQQYYNPQQQQQQYYNPQQQQPWPPQQQFVNPQQQQSPYPPLPPNYRGNVRQNPPQQPRYVNPQQPQQQYYNPQQPQQQFVNPQQWPPQQPQQQYYNPHQQPHHPGMYANQPMHSQQPQQQPVSPLNQNFSGVRGSALTSFKAKPSQRPIQAVTQRMGENGFEDFRTLVEIERDNNRATQRRAELIDISGIPGNQFGGLAAPVAPEHVMPQIKAKIETWGPVVEDSDSFALQLFKDIDAYEARRAEFVHPMTPEQQAQFKIPNRQPDVELPLPNGQKPVPVVEAKARPYDSLTTTGGLIKPIHLSGWTRSWSTQHPFDAAWDPATQVKFLRNDGEEIHEIIEPMVAAMEYLKHEIKPNLKRNLPVKVGDSRVVANFDLLKTLHEVSTTEDPKLHELKMEDIKSSSDVLRIPECLTVHETCNVEWEARAYLLKNGLSDQYYKRPVEATYYGVKQYENVKVGETTLRGIVENIEEIDTITNYVRYLKKLENNKDVPEDFLAELVIYSTKELNRALEVGMNMGFSIDNILEDWLGVQQEFIEELGEEIGNEQLTELELKFGRQIITGGRELADPDEHNAIYSADGLLNRFMMFKDTNFLMLSRNSETKVPWRAGDISLCLTEGKGVIYESKLPQLFAALKAMVARNPDNAHPFAHRYIRTADLKRLEIHTGKLGKDYFILEEVEVF